MQSITGTTFEDELAFSGRDLLYIDFVFADFIGHIRHLPAIGAELELAEGELPLVFDIQYLAFRQEAPGCFCLVTLLKKQCPAIANHLIRAAQHIEEATLDAAVNPGEIQQVGDRGTAKIFTDKVPERVSGQPGVFFSQPFKTLEIFVQDVVAQLVVQLRIPGFANISDQAVFKPGRQVHHHGILYDLLDISAKKHGVEIDQGDAFADLPPQVIVIAIEIDKNLVAHYLRLAAGIVEHLLAADIALLEVGQVGINDNLNFLVDAVLQRILDAGEILFGQHHDRLADHAALAIPIGDEIIAFILRPLVKITVVLHPVFAEFYL